MAKTKRKMNEDACKRLKIEHKEVESLTRRGMSYLKDIEDMGGQLRVEDGCLKIDLKRHPATDTSGHENPFRLVLCLESPCLHGYQGEDES